jgi:hypothetical protein
VPGVGQYEADGAKTLKMRETNRYFGSPKSMELKFSELTLRSIMVGVGGL